MPLKQTGEVNWGSGPEILASQLAYSQSLAVDDTAVYYTANKVLFQLATGSAENGELPRAMDLGHELANIDFSYKNIGDLLDEWHERVAQA